MEPSVGQRTGRTWVFVSVLSVRRFFPPQTADEGSKGSNWMPKSLQKRGKETLHSCDFSRLEWELQYLCKLVTKSQSVFGFFLSRKGVENRWTDFQRRHFLYRLPLSRSSAAVRLSFNQNLIQFWVCTTVSESFSQLFVTPSVTVQIIFVQPLCSRQEGGQVHSLSVRVCSLV